MPKQKLEMRFKESIEKIPNYFMDKLQVNIHANTSTAADFILQTPNYDVLIECKEVNKSTQGFWQFDTRRVTQEKKLSDWENRFERNKSFVVILFWKGNKNKSDLYIIPLKKWLEFRSKYSKCKINDFEMFKFFENYLDKFWSIKNFIE